MITHLLLEALVTAYLSPEVDSDKLIYIEIVFKLNHIISWVL